jgi:tetratricopeptide (TPR) repeat protein
MRMTASRLALFWLAIVVVVAVQAQDIGSDGPGGATDRPRVSTKASLADPERRLAEAYTQYALGMMALREDEQFSNRAEVHFLAALANDPSSLEVIKLLLAGWSDGDVPVPRKVAEKLLPVASANPRAWRLNTTVADALLQTKREAEALSLLEAALQEMKRVPSKTVDDDADALEVITMTASAYSMMERYDEGERLFRRILRDDVLAENFYLRRAAVSFFALQADQGEDGWWLFPSRKQRFRRALDENLAAASVLWQQMAMNAASNREPLPVLELAALLRVCKRYQLFDQGDALIAEALMNDPRDLRATLFYGAFLADSERFAEATRLWRRIATEKPDESDFQFELGRMALMAQWYEEAAHAFDIYLLMNPGDTGALYQSGVAYFEMDKTDKAIYTLKKIVDMPEALYLIALVHRRESRYAEAVATMTEAETLATKLKRHDFLSRDFYLTFAYLCERIKDIPRTSGILERLHQEHPEDAEVANFLGYLWADHNQRLDEAERLIRMALADDPDSAAYLDSLAWVLYRQGRFAEAAVQIERCLRQEGDLPDAVIADHAGDIFVELGDLPRALSYWRLAAELLSDDVDPAKVRAKIARHGAEPTS